MDIWVTLVFYLVHFLIDFISISKYLKYFTKLINNFFIELGMVKPLKKIIFFKSLLFFRFEDFIKINIFVLMISFIIYIYEL